MDRQDIDALLIGALYGELTPADEARLQAHLESHPADRGALDDLKVARQKIQDSRFFELQQLEPPQAVSALLLQEAHRRAPKRVVAAEAGEGWFARFTRSFMAHPAMAAAAMLVLVLGGAGIVYMKKGDQFAEKPAAAPAASKDLTLAADRPAPVAQAPAATATPTTGDGYAYGSAAAGSGYNARLYEDESSSAEGVASDKAKADGDLRRRREDELAAQRQMAERKQALDLGKNDAIAVAPAERAPKDFEDRKAAKKADSADESYSRAKGTAGPARSDMNANAVSGADIAAGPIGGESGAPGASGRGASAGGGGYAQPPPPPAPVTTPAPEPAKVASNKAAAPAPATATTTGAVAAPAQPTAAPKTTVAKKPSAPSAQLADDAPAAKEKAEAPKAEAKPDSSLIAWAKSEHARAVALAQKGDCSGAAKVALGVSNRASAYYQQTMSTDRALKQCTQYIAAERERAAAKARAEKAAEPTSTKK